MRRARPRRLTLALCLMTNALIAGAMTSPAVADETLWLDVLVTAATPPFSFTYADKPGRELLPSWNRETGRQERPDAAASWTSWTDPATGFQMKWEVIRYADFPAVDWVLRLENTGQSDTPIIADLQALDVALAAPLPGRVPYRLHKTNGAPSNPTDFEVKAVNVDGDRPRTMSGGGGRSSNKDLPFFKIESALGSTIVAVGWSGQWLATFARPEPHQLRLTAGLEKTHFTLHPGERVRTPRILILHSAGDTLESNARFRQLIYQHYAAVRDGKKPLPTPYCNTCFTRGGAWLNECNAENQISLINAYAPLKLDALLTDAGWFEGGWPAGAGNWTPRKDAYPDGMGPVAAAAKAKNMIYGLWFEPERVVAGTTLHREHPDWCLRVNDAPGTTYLADFGRPEVRDYFFNIVKGFMDLPSFRVYRQDFNMDPLPYWRATDAPDRQGVTEMKYIEGLYAYWDRIAETWPDSLRIECASGGRRIDLETVTRMHIHQKTDYWFDNEVDQATNWALSQYLPNNLFMTPVNRIDAYSFHSALPSSICFGWIADAPDFDLDTASRLREQYEQVRRLLIGAWYPLLPYSRELDDWIGSQYHRPDLDEGMLLLFRRPESPYRTADVTLHALDPDADYVLTDLDTGEISRRAARDLLAPHPVTIDQPHRSLLITYRKLPG